MMPGRALFNACDYLLDRHVREGRGDRLALTGVAGDLSYAELAGRVTRAAAGLRALGLQPEQRVVMVMADSPEFVIVYLAAMRIGAVPVPISTMLRAGGVAEILADSRARAVAVSAQYLDLVTAALGYPGMGEVMVVTDDAAPAVTAGGRATTALGRLPAGGSADIYPTTADSPAFWLYTSGTTGTPKGAMHRHGSVQVVCDTYGAQVLGITPEDRCLSAAKAFFAYGLGNSVLFPMSVGAAAVLEPNPSRPEIMAERAGQYAATLFFAGPTFFSNMLRAGLPADAWPGSGWPPRPGRLSRPPCTGGGRRTSAATSSTASA
jgi:acyl-coenzyme A synthetase/AMP-(fatty) acid ligase